MSAKALPLFIQIICNLDCLKSSNAGFNRGSVDIKDLMIFFYVVAFLGSGFYFSVFIITFPVKKNQIYLLKHLPFSLCTCFFVDFCIFPSRYLVLFVFCSKISLIKYDSVPYNYNLHFGWIRS